MKIIVKDVWDGYDVKLSVIIGNIRTLMSWSVTLKALSSYYFEILIIYNLSETLLKRN